MAGISDFELALHLLMMAFAIFAFFSYVLICIRVKYGKFKQILCIYGLGMLLLAVRAIFGSFARLGLEMTNEPLFNIIWTAVGILGFSSILLATYKLYIWLKVYSFEGAS